VDHFAPEIDGFLQAGVRYFELHDEPNRADRGAAVSWQNGADFSAWFEEAVHHLRRRYGHAIRIGFPALASSGLPRPEPAAAIRETRFLEQCGSALQKADWAALHVYWRTLGEMRALDGVMRILRLYLEPFPSQTFFLTEIANVTIDLPAAARGRQLTELMTLAAQYDRILGTCGFLLRSSDPRYEPLGWLTPEGVARPVLDEVAGRPKLPDPAQFWLTWPTQSRHYLRLFGEHQREYYDRYWLAGGHNGVDLAVAAVGSERPPVRAALGGTVEQVAHDADGYGRHVRVRSYGPAGQEITLLYAHLSTVDVTPSMLVSRGDLVGSIAVDGSGSPAHLHLGMRMAGVQLPAVLNGLNPRPYLDAQPRSLLR
jgi:murein DD-endopeptidase MepM/ murein hydrolase activator NlpD